MENLVEDGEQELRNIREQITAHYTEQFNKFHRLCERTFFDVKS